MTPLGPTAKEIADYEREVRNTVCHFCGELAKNNCNSCGTPLCPEDTYIEEFTWRVLCEDCIEIEA